MEIDICIATYKRPEKLVRLIESLLEQEISSDIEVRIIVVDNDNSGSAREVVSLFIDRNERVIYDIEPVQNIALARNRTLLLARGEYVAFVDDDEYTDKLWLENLLRVALESGADAVFGPVLPILPGSTPQWIRDGGFFDRPRQKTGSVVPYGRTGNALAKRLSLCEVRAQPFLSELGLTGGSDFELFDKIRASGGKLVWSDEAIVSEEVEENRANFKWLALRHFRGGQVFAERSAERPEGIGLIPWVAWRVAVVLGGVAIATICWPISRAFAAKAFFKSCAYLGQLMSSTAYRYNEYANG